MVTVPVTSRPCAAAPKSSGSNCERRPPPARRAAEHLLQDVVDAAGPPRKPPPAPPPRWTPSGPQVKVSKWPSWPNPPGPRPAARPDALEALEARLALGIDLAAVERLALVVVAEDFIGGVQLGELRRRLLVLLVGVGMQLLREPPEGALDRRRARILRAPPGPRRGRASVTTPMNSLRPRESRGLPTRQFAYMWCRFAADCNALDAAPYAGGQDRVQGRRLLTSHGPCLSRQASPCSQASEPCRARSSPGSRGRWRRPGCRRWRSASRCRARRCSDSPRAR